MTSSLNIPFDNQYIRIADTLFSEQLPTPVKQPELIRLNQSLAKLLGIDPEQLRTREGVEVLAGNRIAKGSEPVATVYAGHQFGHWNPQLGDGRAILLGEVVGTDGLRYDIQLKGAGITPYSRSGDGRSPLGPVLREYIISEAMAAFGVPTTRALAAVASNEKVYRDEILPGAVLTRVARSHIRVGTFQFFSARGDTDTIQKLADHVIARHYPEIISMENSSANSNVYLRLLQSVISRQAVLMAQWLSLGFIHGVMNTDNMLVSGETVDYGPCAFMEAYHSGTVFSSIDQQGRYAYGNQPNIASWNLAWLGQSLLPLIDSDEKAAIEKIKSALDQFATQFQQQYRQRMCAKIGLIDASDDDVAQLETFLSLMHQHQVDFTLGFRVLSDYLESDEPTDGSVAQLYPLPNEFNKWLAQWRERFNLSDVASIESIRQQLNSVNPVFIPRNHRVEQVISAANKGDFFPFHHLVDLLDDPFTFDPDNASFALPATPEEEVLRTFCGT